MADDQPYPPKNATPVSAPADVDQSRQGEPAPQAKPAAAPKKKSRRGLLFALLGGVVVLGAVGYGAYYVLVGSHYVSTDDAYVGADLAQVTPQISGTVQEVRVADTQTVHRGDVLVVIDSADTRLSVAQAQADYGRAQRRVRQYFATNSSAGATVTARQADIARATAQLASARADLERTRIDLQRRQALSASGAVSGEELTSARNAFLTAQANLAATQAGGQQAQANIQAARAQEQAQLALTSGGDVESNPEVTAAKAALDTANLNLSRTVVRAPLDGVVARRQVQVGQRVALGAQLMTIVPVQEAYVDANFKEVQLKKVRIGQPVTLEADLYGGAADYHGKVAGLGGGTGSAFSLIPAQNATGNWIKVVQRVPVRVRIDPEDLRRHPLRVGLSMKAKIDVSGGGQPGAR